MSKSRGTTFYCFSPPVMIATFLIELGLLAYTLWRYKLTSLTRLVAAILAMLAVFQFAEFHVCQGVNGSLYSRFGFIAITFLPPLGIHLVKMISGRGSQALVMAAYATATTFALIFGFGTYAFESQACAGNYAVFHLAPGLGGLYFAYYYFWLILGILQCHIFSLRAPQKIREALMYQAIGYLSFVLPVGIVNALQPTTVEGLPSIMCGFAVIYALILTFAIAPRVLDKRTLKVDK